MHDRMHEPSGAAEAEPVTIRLETMQDDDREVLRPHTTPIRFVSPGPGHDDALEPDRPLVTENAGPVWTPEDFVADDVTVVRDELGIDEVDEREQAIGEPDGIDEPDTTDEPGEALGESTSIVHPGTATVEPDIAIGERGEPGDVEDAVKQNRTVAPEAQAASESPAASAFASVSAAASPDDTIELTSLTKRFGSTNAVQQLTLRLRRGRFIGLVGPNGAGKTTTLSMLCGLVRPTSGRVSVFGTDVWSHRRAAARIIGIVPDRLVGYEQLTAAQQLYYAGVLRGLGAATARTRMRSLLAAFALEADADRTVADFSAGMRKKLALASSLIHSPELLVLDEPFDAIDPVTAEQLVALLKTYADRGGTVLLSSHSMRLVERVCDDVAVLVDGRLVASGAIDDVRGDASFEARFRDLVAPREVEEGLDWLGISFR